MAKRRTEWVKTTEQITGDYGLDAIDEQYRVRVKRHMDIVFRRLVSCRIYGKLLSSIHGGNYSPSRVNLMARAGKLNYFKFSGMMFILMTNAEYEIYLQEIISPIRKKETDSAWRRELMRQPKNREESDRMRTQRLMAVVDYKKGKYKGDAWDTFFLEELVGYEDRFEVNSVEIWLESVGYYVNPDSEAGIRTKRTITVGELWKEYCGWCADEAYVPKYVKEFSVYLASCGFVRRFVNRSRNFDVFVQDTEEIPNFLVQSILMKNEEKEVAAEKERERMMDIQTGLRERMEAKLLYEKDEVWFEGVTDGEHEARVLFDDYCIWCRARKQTQKGRRMFYSFLVDNGMVRETVRGVLMMEKSK